MPTHRSIRFVLVVCWVWTAAVGAASAESVTIEAGRDATLFEHPDGELANGAGNLLFVGRTAQANDPLRRGLLWFDVAGALPDKAIVESVELTLFMAPSNTVTIDVGLYRMLADWSEGPTASGSGRGGPAQSGDVTWLHAEFPTRTWPMQGSAFVGSASAVTPVSGSAFYTWGGTDRLVEDVQQWNLHPEHNFGWIVLGGEAVAQSAKIFASRELPDPALRPTLEVTYRLPGNERPPQIVIRPSTR